MVEKGEITTCQDFAIAKDITAAEPSVFNGCWVVTDGWMLRRLEMEQKLKAERCRDDGSR